MSLSLNNWISIANEAGNLAQKFGPAIANAIQDWWNGTQTQTDLGEITIHAGQQLQILVNNADYEVHIVMPTYSSTTQMNVDNGHGPGNRDDIAVFNDVGTSAIAVLSTNDIGPWNCNVRFVRQDINNPTQWEGLPCLQISDGGNDNAWPNRTRIYLARLNVIPHP